MVKWFRQWLGGSSPPPPGSCASTWLQRPTIAPGGIQEVVGESNYQRHLLKVGGGKTEDGIRICLVTAQLVREPKNRFDPNAVRVDVAGVTVGYLPRKSAPAYHQLIEKLRDEGKLATCRARLKGGWDRGGGDEGSIGISLDINHRFEPTGSQTPFLPPGGCITVVDEQHHQETLETFLKEVDSVETVAVLAESNDGRVKVAVGEKTVGALTPTMSKRYAGWVREVRDAGLDPTCSARIERGSKKIAVYLDLAKP